MTGRIRRRPAALADLQAIWWHVAADDDRAADRLLDRFDEKLNRLADGPLLGQARPELAPGLRSFTVGRYVLFYLPDGNGIELVRVMHGARDIDAMAFP